MKANQLFVTGYHYTNSPKINGAIHSSADSWQNYEFVWSIYKQVADELGKYFPMKFGYAYPEPRSDGKFSSMTPHKVEAPTTRVTQGNFNHSLPITMARLREFTDRSISDMAERKKARDEHIRREAQTYFTELGDPAQIELISDLWHAV